MGSYGVAAAALNYFSKELSELTIEEAAYLAALPKAPNNYHPFRRTKEATDPAQLDHRSDGRRRLHHGRAGQGRQGQAAQGQHPPVRHADLRRRLLRRGRAPHAGRATSARTASTAARSAPPSATAASTAGSRCRTTLDPNLQRMARKALIDGLVAFDREKGWRGAGAEDRHRRRLGRGARPASRSRATWRPGASASCSRRSAPRPWSACARRASPTAASCRSARRSRSPSTRCKWATLGPRRAQGRDRRAGRRRRDLGGAQGPRPSRPASGR